MYKKLFLTIYGTITVLSYLPNNTYAFSFFKTSKEENLLENYPEENIHNKNDKKRKKVKLIRSAEEKFALLRYKKTLQKNIRNSKKIIRIIARSLKSLKREPNLDKGEYRTLVQVTKEFSKKLKGIINHKANSVNDVVQLNNQIIIILEEFKINFQSIDIKDNQKIKTIINKTISNITRVMASIDKQNKNIQASQNKKYENDQ